MDGPAPESNQSPSTGPTWGRAALRAFRGTTRISLLTVWLVAWAALTTWSALALWFAPSGGFLVRGGLAALLAGVCMAALFLRNRWGRQGVPIACWLAVIAWFWFVPASNDRDWQADVRVAPRIKRDGDRITVRSVRDFRYRSETDFDERWEDRSYDLSKLSTLDLFMSYWGPSLICHTFVSFGFERDDGSMEQVCVSIETRKAVGQTYSAVAGAFRQFTLVHVWGDELDIVKLRTNYRREDVYRYRLAVKPEGIRRLFLAYVDKANALADRPEWYNAVTESCGVGIVRLAWADRIRRIPPLRVAFNGLWDRYAFDEGVIKSGGREFGAIRESARINDLAREVTDARFSSRIRSRDVDVKLRPLDPASE